MVPKEVCFLVLARQLALITGDASLGLVWSICLEQAVQVHEERGDLARLLWEAHLFCHLQMAIPWDAFRGKMGGYIQALGP